MGSLPKEIKDIVELSLKGDQASCRKLFDIIENKYEKNQEICDLLKLHGKNSYAQTSLGCFYYYDKKDYKMAFEYYKLSADQGNSHGQRNLGRMYYNGQSVEQDYKMAFKYYQVSADQGDSYGQNNLGYVYQYGHGVKQNSNMAVKYYQLSANQGNHAAQSNLGSMYYFGNGVKKDYSMAINYWQLSADQKKNHIVCQNLDWIKSNNYIFMPGDRLINLVNKNYLLGSLISKSDQLIAHLKYYPGSDSESAIRDFEKIIRSNHKY